MPNLSASKKKIQQETERSGLWCDPGSMSLAHEHCNTLFNQGQKRPHIIPNLFHWTYEPVSPLPVCSSFRETFRVLEEIALVNFIIWEDGLASLAGSHPIPVAFHPFPVAFLAPQPRVRVVASQPLPHVDPAASQVDGMWGHESATNRFVEIETANLWLEDPQGFHAILKVLLGNLHFFRAINLRQPCLDFANASAICQDPRCD